MNCAYCSWLKRALVCALLWSTACLAEPPSAASATATAPATQPRQMSLHPSAPPVPALRYRLLPAWAELEPGNAAPLYLIATSHNLLGNKPDEIAKVPLDDWLAAPADQFPRDD